MSKSNPMHKHVPITAAQYWWNHLSYEQKSFIHFHISCSDIKHISVPDIAYSMNMDKPFSQLDGYPCSVMRII